MHKLFEGLSNFGPEVGAELKRLGTQGAAELAHALFSGSPYLPYGPGQDTPTPEIEKQREEQSREGLQNDGIER